MDGLEDVVINISKAANQMTLCIELIILYVQSEAWSTYDLRPRSHNFVLTDEDDRKFIAIEYFIKARPQTNE